MSFPALPDAEGIAYGALRLLMLVALYGFLFFALRTMIREIRQLALASGGAAGATWQLELREGGRSGIATGVRWRLSRVTTIGRDGDNAIQIDDPFLSGRHAEIRREAGNWWVVDRSSTNGTRLNGAPVTAPTALRAGDIVQFGQIALLVVDPGDG